MPRQNPNTGRNSVREFCEYFAHRRNADKFYREQSKLFEPRYVELFDS